MKTILVIDDEQSIRESLKGILLDEGYRALFAESGEDGLNLLRDESPDLILLDIWLPGIDGLETFRRIAAFKPGQKAVVASGYSETERVKALQGLGVNAYLKKPYALDRLGVLIKQTLHA